MLSQTAFVSAAADFHGKRLSGSVKIFMRTVSVFVFVVQEAKVNAKAQRANANNFIDFFICLIPLKVLLR